MKKKIEERLDAIEKKIDRLFETGLTRVAILQDKSGSMSGKESDVIGGFNAYIDRLREEDNPEKIRVTVAQFDTAYEVQYENASLSEIGGLEYSVRGGTALYDAFGRTIKALEKELRPQDKAIVVIITDGWENSSVEYNQSQIKALVESKQGEGNWTFVYLGADIDAFSGGTSIGIFGGNTFTFSGVKYNNMYQSLAGATSGLSSSNVTSTRTIVQDYNLSDEDKDEDEYK